MPTPPPPDPQPAPGPELDLRFGSFRLSTATRQLLCDGLPLRLGARAFDLLALLVRHRDRVVTHDEVQRAVWPGLVVSENNLQVQVSTLRKLLGADAIATVPRRGYRFTAVGDAPPLTPALSALAQAASAHLASLSPLAPAGVLVSTPGLDIDVEQGTVTVEGQVHRLRRHTLQVLLQLVRHGGLAVGKDALMDAAWPDAPVSENTLHVQIAALRKLLGPTRIATIPGQGYLFNNAPQGSVSVQVPPALLGAGPAAAERWPGNLGADDAARLPPLIGRKDSLHQLGEALRGGSGIVTLCGPGGMGKTRLARAGALALRTAWRDGVWWLDLAQLAPNASLPYAIAHLLRLALPGRASAEVELPVALRPLRLLLVLDNCEHLREHVARLVGAVRAAAPAVQVLATSRVGLGVEGETVLRLAPLSLPTLEGPESALSRAGASEAVRLFVERARAATGWFALDERNAADVSEVCHQLDGLPLAIELAAARVPLLGLQALRERLRGWAASRPGDAPAGVGDEQPEQHLRLLRGSGRATQARHLSLQDALDWSHSLLSPQAQAVYRRVGVFAGGFTLGLAQQVAGDEQLDAWAVLDLVSSLVDQSLIAHDHQDPPRFHLLETARVHALACLESAGEAAATRRRHTGLMRQLLDEGMARRDRGQWPEYAFADALLPELPNALRALQTARDAGDADTALALADVVGRLLFTSGRAVEAIALLAPLAPLAADPGASALNVARWQRRLGRCGVNGRLPNDQNLARLAAARAAFAALGLPRDEHECLWMWAETLLLREQGPQVLDLLAQAQALEQPDWHALHRVHRLQVEGRLYTTLRRNTPALEAFQRARELAVGCGMAYQQLGLLCDVAKSQYELCQTERAVQTYREVVALARERATANTILADGLMGLATSLIVLGKAVPALEALVEVAAMWRRSGLLLARGANVGWALVAMGHSRAGAHWLGAVEGHHARLAAPTRELRHRQALEILQRRQPQATLDVWLAEGQTIELDALLDALDRCSGIVPQDEPPELVVGDDDVRVQPGRSATLAAGAG